MSRRDEWLILVVSTILAATVVWVNVSMEAHHEDQRRHLSSNDLSQLWSYGFVLFIFLALTFYAIGRSMAIHMLRHLPE